MAGRIACFIKYVSQKEVPFGCLFFAFGFFATEPVLGYQLEELQPFSLGVIAVPSNSIVSELEQPPSGRNIRVTGNIIVVNGGIPGRYRLSDFPANTPIEVDVDPVNLNVSGAGPAESLTADQFEFGEIVTDGTGSAEFQVGATVATSGTGTAYPDAPYSGNGQFNFTFWEPAEGKFITVGFNAEVEIELSTSFAIEELQSFSFGTIFARSSSAVQADQATLSLLPNGKFTITNKGDARIVSISPPSPGVIGVSSAAPNQLLNITLDSSQVLLTNQSRPGSPYFILENLVSDPVNEGRTDENGVLEIRLGGDLSTQSTSEPKIYPAGDYSGEFEITVTY